MPQAKHEMSSRAGPFFVSYGAVEACLSKTSRPIVQRKRSSDRAAKPKWASRAAAKACQSAGAGRVQAGRLRRRGCRGAYACPLQSRADSGVQASGTDGGGGAQHCRLSVCNFTGLCQREVLFFTTLQRPATNASRAPDVSASAGRGTLLSRFGAIGSIGAAQHGDLVAKPNPCSWTTCPCQPCGRKNTSIRGVTLSDVCCIHSNSHRPSGSISGRHWRWLLCWL